MGLFRKRIAPEDVAKLVTRCEDAATDAQLEARLRRLRRNVLEMPSRRLSELPEVLENLRESLRKNEPGMARIHLARAEELTAPDASPGQRERKKHMGLLDKVKSVFGDREAKARDKLMSAQESEAAKNVYALTQKIEGLGADRAKLAGELESIVGKCKALPKGSAEYVRLSQQGKLLIPRIKTLDKQIAMHTKVLEDNSVYQSMIASGKLTLDLKNYVMDTSKAEATLDMITDQVETVSEDIAAFGDSVNEYGGKLDKVMGVDVSSLDDAFDSMVAEAPEPAAEQPAAPQAQETKPETITQAEDDEFERLMAKATNGPEE